MQKLMELLSTAAKLFVWR